MAIVTTLTFNSTAYDVSDYVMRHSIEIDEQLFNPDNLKPTTNRCDFRLSRSCPYIDELFAWTGDVEVSIVADGVAAFTGYLTDNYGLKITARGASDVSLSAEDPGIKKLKTAWVSTGALVTVFSGEKVCDPADTTNSFVHILAGLAGVTLATTLPTIGDTIYFSVQDKDKKQYWDILEKVLLDYRHVFYFDAGGKLALFALDGLTGTASQYVCTNGTILQKSPGDPGVEIKKRLIQYKEVIVNFDEGETLASATVFRDTTGQGLTDCEIEIAAGAYYPTSCDASTYAYIDYFLEDGREIKAVDSITADFSLDSGITYEMTNLGTSAQIRFYNPTGLARSIRKLKITGTNVLAIKADSKVTSTVAGGKKLEYDAAYITELADAQSLANLLRYYYANSGSLYTFRAYAGTLYPSDTLFPSDTLYPLGDIILLGDITRLHDPVWTGLDVNCGIYRKKYTVGKAGATFDAVGIGTINLADAVSLCPIVKTPIVPVYSNYPSQKSLTALTDPVDFNGQYGIYNATRYAGVMPNTWVIADIGYNAYQELLQMIDRSTITPQEKNIEARRWIAIAGDGATTGTYWTTRNHALNVGVPTDEMDYDYYNLYAYLFATPGVLSVATWNTTINVVYATYEGLWAQLNTSIAATNYTISKFTGSTLYENLDCGDYSIATNAETDAFMTDFGEYLEAYEDFDMADYDALDFAMYDSGDYETGIADTQPNWDCGVHSVGSLILLFPSAEVDCGEF